MLLDVHAAELRPAGNLSAKEVIHMRLCAPGKGQSARVLHHRRQLYWAMLQPRARLRADLKQSLMPDISKCGMCGVEVFNLKISHCATLAAHRHTFKGNLGKWQGHQGSNPGPTVLETVALPTELYPYGDAWIKRESDEVQGKNVTDLQFRSQNAHAETPECKRNYSFA